MSDRPQDQKKSYEPPKLVRVNLRPEEAVLGHCKSASASGPGNANCAILSCMNLGS
jgi:hypothetical protein